jgi:predicted transcriptional regulator
LEGNDLLSYDPPESDQPPGETSSDVSPGFRAPCAHTETGWQYLPDRPNQIGRVCVRCGEVLKVVSARVEDPTGTPPTGEFHLGPGKGVQEVPLEGLTSEEKKGTASKTHRLRLLWETRSADIFQRRLGGKTIRQIASEFGITAGGVSKILKKEYDKVHKRARESADQIKQLHLERLDFMYSCLMPGMLAGNSRSIDMATKVLERMARLEGLDAPEKKQVDITVEYTDAELVQQAKRLRLEVPEVLRALAERSDIIDAEIIPPEAIRDRPPPAPEAQGPAGQAAPEPGPG